MRVCSLTQQAGLLQSLYFLWTELGVGLVPSCLVEDELRDGSLKLAIASPLPCPLSPFQLRHLPPEPRREMVTTAHNVVAVPIIVLRSHRWAGTSSKRRCQLMMLCRSGASNGSSLISIG